MTKKEFLAGDEITVTIDGTSHKLFPKQFSTGSVGYGLNQKMEKRLKDGTVVTITVGLNMTVNKSKEWKDA